MTNPTPDQIRLAREIAARVNPSLHAVSEDLEEIALAALSAPLAQDVAAGEREADGWRPIETAPKDRTVIWAVLRGDLYPVMHPCREDLARWNGVQICLRHPGIADDGFDIGWGVAAPVGHGGFPDDWIAGWMPLPAPPATAIEKGEHDDA